MLRNKASNLLDQLEEEFTRNSISENFEISLQNEITSLEEQVSSLKQKRNQLKHELKHQSELSENNKDVTGTTKCLSTAYRLCGVSVVELSDDHILVYFDSIYHGECKASYSLSLNLSSYPPEVLGQNFPSSIPVSSMCETCEDSSQMVNLLKDISSAIEAHTYRAEEIKRLKKLTAASEYEGAVEVVSSDSGIFLQIFLTFKSSEIEVFKTAVHLTYEIADKFPREVTTVVTEGKPSDTQYKTISKRSKHFKNLSLCDAFSRLFRKSN